MNQWIWAFIFFLTSLSASANFITLEDVLKSTDKHYPDIQRALIEIESAEQDRIAKQGYFDTKLGMDGYSREEGYYSGDFIKVNLKKNLPVYGIKVYSGYKISDGDFPAYEGEMETLDNGEFSAGFSIPLLRNREIDKSRLDVALADNKIDKSKIKVLQKQIDVREKAMKAYWTWLATGKVMDIYQRLFDIANKRQTALEKKHKRGDVAKIYLSENMQYILKRQNKLLEAQNYFQNAARNLALFYRDNEGKPVIPTKENLKKSFLFEEASKEHKYREFIDGIIQNHPDVQSIENKMRMFKLLEKGAETDMLPLLDFGFEVRKDTGLGSKSLAGEDRRFMFTFSLPFENRKAKGSLQSARIMQRSIAYKKQLLQEKLDINLKNLIDTIDTNVQVFNNGQQEVKLAEKLEKAEQTKFFQGDSDFFVVNLREQMTAEAQIKNIMSALKVNKFKAQFQSVILQSEVREKFDKIN